MAFSGILAVCILFRHFLIFPQRVVHGVVDHFKAYGFLFPIKDAVTILELLPGCHGNMHYGIFGHISSLYPI